MTADLAARITLNFERKNAFSTSEESANVSRHREVNCVSALSSTPPRAADRNGSKQATDASPFAVLKKDAFSGRPTKLTRAPKVVTSPSRLGSVATFTNVSRRDSAATLPSRPTVGGPAMCVGRPRRLRDGDVSRSATVPALTRRCRSAADLGRPRADGGSAPRPLSPRSTDSWTRGWRANA